MKIGKPSPYMLGENIKGLKSSVFQASSLTLGLFDNSYGGEKAVGLLKVFAYINLIAGIIGAVFIWSTMSTIEIPYGFVKGTYTETNPIGVAMGFVALIEGVFGWALFLTVHIIANNVAEIKNSIISKKSEEIIT